MLSSQITCTRFWLAPLFLLASSAFAGGPPAPTFQKTFAPDVIGPGSTSTLTFSIVNPAGPSPLTGLSFVDGLPGGMTLASPALVSNTCGGTVVAPAGGTSVSLTDGQVGAGTTCTLAVLVTAGAVDASDTLYQNVSGNLSWDGGGGGTAADDLTVDVDRPGFTKSFAPSTVAFGGRSTLTFTIDNTLNAAAVPFVTFSDLLPAGMTVADPAFASTDCDSAPTVEGTLVATPGSSSISYLYSGSNFFPAVPANGTCTIDVDVVGAAVGSLGNVSSDLGLTSGAVSGKAAAVLTVTGVTDLLELGKEFVDDPAPPGGTVTLAFQITNKSRTEPATGITFDDNLEDALAGLAPLLPPSPDPPCGAGSALSFAAGVLTLAGGNLPPEGSCSFSVELAVPAGAAPGGYPNTTGPISGLVGSSPEVGNAAGDLLFVASFAVLTKEFTDDPVGAGDTVTLEFSLTNPEAGSTMSGISFVDELTDNSGEPASGAFGNGFLPFPVSVTLPPIPDPPCGPGSSLALVSLGTDRQGLQLTGGGLAAAGDAGGGDSCTFSVTLTIPAGFPAGVYSNTTEPTSAVLDDFPGAPTVVGKTATDDIEVVGAPTLSKEFTDDPVPPGGTVTLELQLQHDALASADATGIAFTDNLPAGLTAASVDSNTCAGSTVDISTPTAIDFSGGTLAPGASCTVSLTLSVPGGASSGVFTNTTSDVTATVGGIAVTGDGAQDDLLITGLLFSKAFAPSPVIAGGTTTLSFTLDNTTGTQDATAIFFTDNLPTGWTVSPPTPNPPCGAGSALLVSGNFLNLIGGEVTSGTSCTFGVDVTVPPATADDLYPNVTSPLSATIGGSVASLPAATGVLEVRSNLLALTKEFLDDPAEPGGTVTLALTLTNLSATDTVTDIAFDDDLDAALSGLAATGASANTCGGMANSGFPTGLFQYAGGSLGPAASCSIVLDVDLPPAPLPGNVFTNTTTAVAGKVGALDVFGDPASDDLVVRLLTLAKSFDGPTVAGGSADLTFTLTNLDASNGAAGLAFSDDLAVVLPGLAATLPPTPDPPCGAGSAVTGTSFLALTGGSLAPAGSPGDSCSFTVTVAVPTSASAGSHLNTTSQLSAFGLEVAGAATASLVIEPPPTFAKAFAPASVGQGAPSTLTFTIDNSASSLAASALDFTDNLPAGLVVATPANAATTCTGGTITATPGAGVIAYSGGTVAAGTSCTVQADVVATVVGFYLNVTGNLTSSSGDSGTAAATLEVVDTEPPVVAELRAAAGPLADCDTLRVPVQAIAVTIVDGSSPIQNAGDPANYGVLGAGPDGDFSTTTCGAAAGDDVEIAILALGLDASDPLAVHASLTLATDVAGLVPGLYRVLVCDAITDAAGNALDGDGDMAAGGDFVLPSFRADPFNSFENGHFDDCPVALAPWTTVVTPPNVVATGTPGVDDVDGSPLSASVSVMSAAADPSAIAQCVSVAAGLEHELRAQVRFAPTAGALGSLEATCEFFDAAGCAGASLGTQSQASILEDSAGAWVEYLGTMAVPAAAASALCDLTVAPLGADPSFDAYLDGLFLGADGIIFADGFESGDVSAWSSSQP